MSHTKYNLFSGTQLTFNLCSKKKKKIYIKNRPQTTVTRKQQQIARGAVGDVEKEII